MTDRDFGYHDCVLCAATKRRTRRVCGSSMTGGTGTGDDAASASVGIEATGGGDAEEAGEQVDAAGTAPWFDAIRACNCKVSKLLFVQ